MAIIRDRTKQARQISLVDYCEYKGFDLLDEGRGDFRVKGYEGLIVKDNMFKWHSKNLGGNPIDFCEEVLGMKFKDAVEELLSFQDKSKATKYSPSPYVEGAGLEKKKDRFILPEQNVDNKRVYAYLTEKRRLPGQLINELIEKKLLYQDIRGNCVFVCYDEAGQPRGAILRGTSDMPFKGRAENSEAIYGWLLKPNHKTDQVLVTEAPIDALSVVTYFPNYNIIDVNILALGGLMINTLKCFLEAHSEVEKIILGMDNDAPATNFIQDVKQELEADYTIIEFRPKTKKDWNEELKSIK